MTRFLARLADFSYRRRGTVVLAWIGAADRSDRARLLAQGRVRSRLQHPRIGVEGGQRPDRTRVRRLFSGQEIYVVWKDPNGAAEPGRPQARRRISRRSRSGQARRPGDRDPRLQGRHDRDDDAADDRPRLGGDKEQGEQLIEAAEETAAAASRSSSAANRSTVPRKARARRASASSARRSSC